ncbi:MAG TPA: AAA family ATPase, partial [Chloroflexota bacterium]|nr:AAA family ATPase [Chloroflexota bacterium]
MDGPGDYLPRLADGRVDELFAGLPALMITGPRAAGKTTTALRHARTVVHLDDELQAPAFRGNPDAALRALPEPVLLDEWQVVPGVLGAVKRAVDADFRPGRFVLTGSVRARLEGEMWPATGRVTPVHMAGLSVRELLRASTTGTFLEKLAAGDMSAFKVPANTPDLLGYIELGLRSGFPQAALARSARDRRALLDGYVDQLLTRDVELVAAPRASDRLRRYFEALALNSAGLPEHATLFGAAGINRMTALAYYDLFMSLFVLDLL